MLGNSDDRSGGVFIGILITFGSVITAAAATVFERILQNGVDIKSENEQQINMSSQGNNLTLQHDNEID
jgi:hypothetical protein